jgi:hypothetical protein
VEDAVGVGVGEGAADVAEQADDRGLVEAAL